MYDRSSPWMNDAEAREWAAEFGGNDSWYWSEEQGKYLSIADGQSDTFDVGQAIGHDRATPEQEIAAADYWTMAAMQVESSTGTNLALAEIAFGEDDSSHNLAVLREAEAAHAAAQATLAAVEGIRAEVGAETGVDDKADPVVDPLAVTGIVDYLYDATLAAGMSEAERADYVEDLAVEAEQLADAGYTAERLQADAEVIEEAAELGEGLTPEGQIAVEDELVALADMERQAAMEADSYERARYADAAEALVNAERHAEVRALYDELYDADAYARVEGNGMLEDSYCDGVWDHAEALVDAGATAAEYRLAAEWATAVAAEASWAELNPDAEWAANEDAAAAREAFATAVDAQLREHGRRPSAPGATDEALAGLLFELDQARCALDDDATPEEDRHSWEQQVEHLEDQVALAQGVPHGEVFPATPQAGPQFVDGADAEAWGVPDGTPVDELPRTYAEWQAEGDERSDGDGLDERVDYEAATWDAHRSGPGGGWDPAAPPGTGPVPSPVDATTTAGYWTGNADQAIDNIGVDDGGFDTSINGDDPPLASTAAVAEAHAAVEASAEAEDVPAAEPVAAVSASDDVDE